MDFELYDKGWYKGNVDAPPFEPGLWLGVSDRTGRLMTYHILTQRGAVITRSAVQRVTNLELSTDSVKAIFNAFDAKIAAKFKTGNMGYADDKPNPEG